MVLAIKLWIEERLGLYLATRPHNGLLPAFESWIREIRSSGGSLNCKRRRCQRFSHLVVVLTGVTP